MIDIPNAQFAIRATVESEKKPAEAITASFIGATYLVVDSSPIYRIDWMSTVGGLEPGISLKPTPNWKEATLGKAHSEVLKRFSGNPIIKPSLLQE